jgi:hypothetical protein
MTAKKGFSPHYTKMETIISISHRNPSAACIVMYSEMGVFGFFLPNVSSVNRNQPEKNMEASGSDFLPAFPYTSEKITEACQSASILPYYLHNLIAIDTNSVILISIHQNPSAGTA